MTGQFAQWPEEVAYSGPKLDIILGVLEYAARLATADHAALRAIRRAQLVVWRKLWPELADQYEDPHIEGEE